MNVELIEPPVITEIAEYSQTEAALAGLRERMANVEYDVSTVKGMEVAKKDRAEVRGLRTGLESMRKHIKAPALAHCKLIDAEAARITAELLKLEEPIDQQIKAREAAMEAEKAARELAERQRITAIHQRIADVRNFHALALECRTAERVQILIERADTAWLAYQFEDDFQEFGVEAQTAYNETHNRMVELHAQKLADEAERAAIKAAQVAETERLAAEKAIQDAAAQKLADERAAFAAEQAAFRAQQAAIQAAALEKEEANLRAIAEQAAKDEAQQAEKELAEFREAIMPAVEVATPEVAPLALSGEMVVVEATTWSAPIPDRPTSFELVQCIADRWDVPMKVAEGWLNSYCNDFTPDFV